MKGDMEKWWDENEKQFMSDACHMSEFHMASVVWDAATLKELGKWNDPISEQDMLNTSHAHAIRKARSMDVFADGDASFVFGEWRKWEAACHKAGRALPPSEFKKKCERGLTMKRDEILDAVKKTICNDRQDVHGNPEDTHALIATLWEAYLGNRAEKIGIIEADDVAIMMCLFKIARYAKNPAHLDNVIDLIGYAAIAAELGDHE